MSFHGPGSRRPTPSSPERGRHGRRPYAVSVRYRSGRPAFGQEGRARNARVRRARCSLRNLRSAPRGLRGRVRRVLRAGPCRRSGAGRGDHPGAAHPVRTGSPAQAGGLRAGDRMFAVDGNLVPDARVAVAALRSRRPGSTVVLTVGRGNGRLHLSVRPATGLPRSAPR
ncbi:PDZ domain-containing protein [Streptomyces griseofuscus]|uniref:PDZ domain-containing protein n=1 Tax=Streptomyces griseofuscus TaxID=146922 RepID=UPI003411BB93